MSRFTARYLPLPQPTSRPTEPGASPCRKRSMIGQGFRKKNQHIVFFFFIIGTSSNAPRASSLTLYRVEEKCEAICSYTSWTCSSSYASPFATGSDMAANAFKKPFVSRADDKFRFRC